MLFYGDKLKTFRESKRLTQEELGKKINRTRQSADNYERGENNPSPEIAYALRRVLGCSIYDISDLKPEPDDPALISNHQDLSIDQKRIIDILQELPDIWQSKVVTAALEIKAEYNALKKSGEANSDPGELCVDRTA